jgi:hypothetical protein
MQSFSTRMREHGIHMGEVNMLLLFLEDKFRWFPNKNAHRAKQPTGNRCCADPGGC